MRELCSDFVPRQQQSVDLLAKSRFHQYKPRPMAREVEPFKRLPLEPFDVEAEQIDA